jgi:hypothetical protein
MNPLIVNLGVMQLPVDVVIAGDQPEPIKGRATPLSGALSGPMRAIFEIAFLSPFSTSPK